MRRLRAPARYAGPRRAGRMPAHPIDPFEVSMDWKDTPQQAAWRDEIRGFIKTELPDEFKRHDLTQDEMMGRGRGLASDRAAAWESWRKALAAKGWIAPAWPKEYGGAGMTVDGAVHLQRGVRRAGAPRRRRHAASMMIGPDAHRARHRGAEEAAPAAASSTARCSGARATASRAPAPTSPRSRPAPCATATTTSSTARRSGPPARTTRTGCSCSRAPTRTRRSTAASPTS